jgi:hypothetical protein
VWIIKRSDGSYYAVPITPSYHDECKFEPGALYPPDSLIEPGADFVAIAHTHPSKEREKVYCKNQNQAKAPVDLYPNDPVGVETARTGSDYKNGGGSDSDWGWAQKSPHVDVYSMNKDDEIHRLPAYTPIGDERVDRNQRRKYWRGSKAACPF